MSTDDFFDFMIEGGDELMDTEECPHCGKIINLDDKCRRKCSNCGQELKMN